MWGGGQRRHRAASVPHKYTLDCMSPALTSNAAGRAELFAWCGPQPRTPGALLAAGMMLASTAGRPRAVARLRSCRWRHMPWPLPACNNLKPTNAPSRAYHHRPCSPPPSRKHFSFAGAFIAEQTSPRKRQVSDQLRPRDYFIPTDSIRAASERPRTCPLESSAARRRATSAVGRGRSQAGALAALTRPPKVVS